MKEKRTEQRQEAKLQREKGEKYLKKIKRSVNEHAQINDPLFKVKGMERHRRINA